MRLTVVGYTGPYVLPEGIEGRTDHLVHVCAGSGSVPNFSILKHALRHNPTLRHTFVYSNKTWEDIIFRDALTRLEREHPKRLRVIHTLTRETHAGVRQGRVTPDLLREAIPDPSAAVVYACGPAISTWDRRAARDKGEEPAPRFLETVVEALGSLGVAKDRIRTESYG
jgi:ferredoxin-NADP reductase